ncbi:hypothetical protein PG996_004273 [Apiospora saccharicola]|uniref:Uncharacterized protein n=1 Tax=Apiospora saccharicola TaxID=335842 RepID=A0ABR1W3P5_9PEZI
MSETPEDDFNPSHTFTHPYSDSEVLRNYLVEKAEIKESEFRIRVTTAELQLKLTENPERIDQKKLTEINDCFKEAERKRKQVSRGGLPKVV